MTAKTPEPAPEPRPGAGQAGSGDAAAGAASGDASGSGSAAASTPTTPPSGPAPAAGAPAKPSAQPPARSTGAPAGGTKPVLPPARPGPAPRRGGGAATVVAVLSLLVAAGATGIAVYALDVAREAKSAAAERYQPEATVAAPTAAATQAPTPEATAAPTAVPTPTPAFRADLVSARVTIPQVDSCASRFVDVDRLQVGVDVGHEFYLYMCYGPQMIRVDRKDAAVPTGANPDPDQCAAQLAGVTISTDLVMEVRVGLSVCLLTSKADAVTQDLPQRLAIVEVISVGPDKSVTLEISTFQVPDSQV